MKHTTIVMSAMLFLAATLTAAHSQTPTGPVMEIAIRQVKEGQEEAFFAARAAFIEVLTSQEGIEQDWEFQSFFTMPMPNETPVYVGMTCYESLEAVAAISDNLMGTDAAQNFFGTFDMQAFVLVQAADGSAFNLEDVITEPGQVLEVAVRAPQAGTEDQFDSLRQGFFDQVAAQPGYIMDKEFIDLQSGANVVLIAWESLEDFQAALGVLSQQPAMGAFFEILDVQAYQALQLTTNE
jgi:heme-degrading monooxygenase HmoA